jgi:hypothetical protein
MNESDYLYKYLKYKYKYLTLQNYLNDGGKKKKKKSTNIQIDPIKALTNFTITEQDSKMPDFIKLGLKSIPAIGPVYGFIDIALIMNSSYSNFMDIFNKASALKKIIVIRFKKDNNVGPDIIKEQFEQLWSDPEILTDDERKFLCKNNKVLMKHIMKIIKKFIEGIPQFGPLISAFLISNNVNLITFETVETFFDNLPDEIKDFIYEPEKIILEVNKIIREINNKYKKMGINLKKIEKTIKKKKKKVKKGGFDYLYVNNIYGSGPNVAALVSKFSPKMDTSIIKKNIGNITKSMKPAIAAASLVGLNPFASQIINFVTKQLTPGILKTVNFLEKILPLMFTLPLIDEKCKDRVNDE